MNRAVTRVIVIALGAAAIGGTLHWRARHASPPAASAVEAGSTPQPTPAPAEAGADANTSAPTPGADRAQLESDVAARIAVSMAASKAKADAERLAALNHPAPELSLEDLISRSLPAVVRVETTDGLGTGFFIAPD